jgi:hypothetical protein
MKKQDREKIFNKYGGKCAYCGCELQKGWHVDEIEPVMRKRKYIPGGWFNKTTGERVYNLTEDNETETQWRDGKWVSDGMEHPHRLTIENQNPACASCNINKHSGSLEDFRDLITGFMNHLNNVSTQYKFAKRYGLLQETNNPVVFYFETLNEKK